MVHEKAERVVSPVDPVEGSRKGDQMWHEEYARTKQRVESGWV